ncbi:hypothetical protein SDC9_93360 [bioreactor metagenome]|uniref:Uncharacterized protein n=1 Tax=bioreactor metagenome TaxID=1076179 RepID=A0A645A0C6_9ZZZZ
MAPAICVWATLAVALPSEPIAAVTAAVAVPPEVVGCVTAGVEAEPEPPVSPSPLSTVPAAGMEGLAEVTVTPVPPCSPAPL